MWEESLRLLKMCWSFLVLELLNSRWELDEGSIMFNSFSKIMKKSTSFISLTNAGSMSSQDVTAAECSKITKNTYNTTTILDFLFL